ncbi:OB-fold domain-containing protein [Gordonia sp. CPCC 206044]|uniref:Zn-ribbon domain-containing OB-fold protein n=1 Tax=Gordonia sp. CPCC 206044 TaxID=3140793 RepID=UPI003AF4005E
MIADRPLPVPDDDSAQFWEAAARHQLVIARCGRCEQFSHPPDSVCPHCGSTEPVFTFAPVSGRGVIRSWTVARQSFLPGFDALLPFVLVDVELVEQSELRMIGRLLDSAPEGLRIGSAVDVVFEEIADDLCVPAFVLC